jgi:Eukaryotic glutathione synthase, ATP binding domain
MDHHILAQVVGLGLEEVPCAVVHAPVAVLPTQFPRSAFLRAKEVMPLLNSLADAVSQDDDYLQRTLTPAAQYDPFTVCATMRASHSLHLISPSDSFVAATKTNPCV